jgi:hypothetical protein
MPVWFKILIQTREASDSISNFGGARGSGLNSKHMRLILWNAEAFLCLKYEGELCGLAPVQIGGRKWNGHAILTLTCNQQWNSKAIGYLQ